jgi:putative peptidoglycan lipid II flippase
MLLRVSLNTKVGRTGVSPKYVLTLWVAALGAGAAGFGVKLAAGGQHRIVLAVLVLGAFGVAYFVATRALRIPESAALLDRVRRVARMGRR